MIRGWQIWKALLLSRLSLRYAFWGPEIYLLPGNPQATQSWPSVSATCYRSHCLLKNSTGHALNMRHPQAESVQKWSFYDPFWSYRWTSWSGLHFTNHKVSAISHLSERIISPHPPHSPLPRSPPLALRKSVWMSFLSFVTEWDLIWSSWF